MPSKQFFIKLLFAALIFVSAFFVRFLHSQDNAFDLRRYQPLVVADYERQADHLAADGIFSLLDADARASDINFMLHPPGYPILQAIIFNIAGKSDWNVQVVTIIADALACAFIFLIFAAILAVKIGCVAGFLTAFAPQMATNSIALLPDSLAVFPIVVGVWLLVKFHQKPSFWFLLGCGACFGLSCWFRANALLLAPFVAAVFWLGHLINARFIKQKFEWRRKTWQAAMIILGAVVVIAPLTIRNYIVFQHFVPVSLGAGQTLIEGVGDYDPEMRFGFPRYDWDVLKQEAEMFNRPDYQSHLLGADGIARDRQRARRVVEFAANNPIWFVGTMFRRAVSMMQPGKNPAIAAEIPVTRKLNDESVPFLILTSQNIAGKLENISDGAKIIASDDEQIIVQTGQSKYAAQFALKEIEITPHTENVAQILLNLREGRLKIFVVGVDSSAVYSSINVDSDESKTVAEQTTRVIEIPFVSREAAVKFVVHNEAPAKGFSLVEIKRAEVFALGAARFGWTRPFRTVFFYAQKIFTAPVLLTLEIIGLMILLWRRDKRALFFVFVVPFYYFCVQSALHTEYRYIIALHYFLFGLAAIAAVTICQSAIDKFRRRN